MGTSLTGKNISASYLGLLKSTDNLAISTSAKTITDGAGNDLPIKLSTAQFLVSDGSVSAPTIGFSNETNTGFYHTTGEINATIAGTNKITIDGSQTHIKGSTLLIDSSDDSGRLQFNYGPATNSRSWRILNDNISDGDFWIGFSDTRTSSSYQTALNINKDGNIALGGGSASSVYDISLGGNTFITASNTTALKINRGASYGDILELQSQGGVFAQFSGIEAGTTRILKIDGYDTDSEIRLSTSGSNRFIIDTNGNVRFNSYGGGTITGTATQRLGVDLNGNVIEIPIGAGAVDGSGTANYISKWTDSDTLSDSVIYDDGTNVGIGTSSINSNNLLQVSKSIDGGLIASVENVNTGTSAYAELQVRNSASNNTGAVRLMTLGSSYTTTGGFVQDSAVLASDINLGGGLSIMTRSNSDIRFYTNGHTNERVRIDSSGNVGINEDNPLQKLHVNSGSGNSPAIFESTDLNSQIWLKDSSSSTTYQTGIACSGDNLIFNNGGEKARLDSNGNLGLATASASSFNQLTTQGSAPVLVVGNGVANPSISIYSANDSVGSLSFAHGTTTTEQYKGLIQYNHGTNGMSFYTDASLAMTIDSNGNSDFNGSITADTTSTPTLIVGRDGTDGDVIQVYNGATGTTKALAIGVDGNDGTIFSQFGDIILQSSAGNVGIGESSPSAPLHISSNNGAIARFANNSATLTTTFLNVINANDTSNGTVIAHIDDGTSYIGNQQNNALRLVTNDTEHLRIGTVGHTMYLGGSTSAYQTASRATLKLQGTSSSLLEFATDTESIGYIYGASSGIDIVTTGSDVINFYTNNTYRARITSGGELLVNRNGASGYGKLNVDGGADFTGGNVLLCRDSGSVGIGLSAPDAPLHVIAASTSDDALIQQWSYRNDLADQYSLILKQTVTSGVVRYNFSMINDYTSYDDVLVLDRGYVSVGTTETDVTNNTTVSGINFMPDGVIASAGSSYCLDLNRVNSSNGEVARFRKQATQVGNISVTGSATSYNTSSDYRLKENVVELTGALDRISQLKPSRFNFIADAETTVDGFLAHEVQDIIPEAITGEKDATEEYEVTPEVLDDEGNVIEEAVMGTRDVYQGIDQSKLVPLLVASIQELKAEIDELKKKI